MCYYVEVETTGVKKQYVKAIIYDEFPLLGTSKEAEAFSKEYAMKIRDRLEKELQCVKARVNIVTELPNYNYRI